MVFEFDPDRPDVPGIARLLFWLGMIALIGCVVSVLLVFSRFYWVNQTIAMVCAVAAFAVALILVGQAKTLELLAVVSARVKSRFALEHTLAAQAHAPAAPAERKPIQPTAAQPARVISIPENVAREQGITRTPEPRDFR